MFHGWARAELLERDRDARAHDCAGWHFVRCGHAGEEQRQVEEHCEWRRYVVKD